MRALLFQTKKLLVVSCISLSNSGVVLSIKL